MDSLSSPGDCMSQSLPSPLPPAVAAAIQQRYDQSPVSTQAFNLDGWTVYVNAAWERLFHAPREVASLFNIFEDRQLNASGIMPRIRTAFAGLVVHADPVPFEARLSAVRGQQSQRWIAAVFRPIRDAAGVLVGVLVQHCDVSAEYGDREAG
jgi:PAS domain-containing protein